MSRLSSEYISVVTWAVAIACAVLLSAGTAWAGYHDAPNTVRIGKVTVAPRDAKTATVSLDISWRGWRHEINHLAVWTFFKVRAEGDSDWQHVRLVADKVLNPAGYRQEGGTPLDYIVPRGGDGLTGMFLRRAEPGQGTIEATKVTAVWDFTVNKNITRDVKVDMRAFAIEMVYVPDGPFNLGSGGAEISTFFMYTDGVHNDTPYRVVSPGAIPTGRQKGKLWSGKGAAPEDGGEIPAAFPNGYAAFYCMRSYIRAGEYAGFLDTLPEEEAAKHYIERSRIIRSKNPPYAYTCESAPDHTTGGLSWVDGAAFGAWAGLRPITELEYEKASRGPMEPGWETGHSLQHNSYWDIKDFNGWKTDCIHPVTVANAVGRRFRGTHGRGTTDLPADWPQEDAIGAGTRGGWTHRHPSNRAAAATLSPDRAPHQKWRGVRTAPKEVGP